MKFNENVLANTLGSLGAVYYLVCYVVASVAPGLYKSVAASWMHMINLEGLWKRNPSGFILGLVSFTVVSWVSGWVFAKTYNYFLGKK